MDTQTRTALLDALIGTTSQQRWSMSELVERSGLAETQIRRGLDELQAEDPPLAHGDVDATTGAETWWMLPHGPDELDRLRDQGSA